MLKYGDGGHKRAGICQVPVDHADSILEAIISQMNADG
jgi:nanoRNase/pAp phosphatase (c-di-AMP/oligoRNAs hydrolase)